jgi:hypothetical protein
VRWPEIWASNRHVKNPHWIFPGDRLLMCTYEGRPIIGKDEGDGCEGIIRRYTGGTKLQPQARVESLNNAFLSFHWNTLKTGLNTALFFQRNLWKVHRISLAVLPISV